jgi:ribosome biogenesis GTPase
LGAINSGMLDKDKYDNYIKLLKENEYNTMTKLEKRKEDYKFGKFIKTAKKQIKKYKIDFDR